MSIQSEAFARMRRDYALDLTPWCRDAAGDTSTVHLPNRYHIYGNAATRSGPFRLTLKAPGGREVADQWVTAAKDVPTWLQILSDLAELDRRERSGVVVTADADGFVRAIEASDG